MKNKFYISLAVVVLIFAGLWVVGQGQGQKSVTAKQAWEYKLMFYTIGGGVPAKTTLYEDGKILPASSNPISRANELGGEGWELVSVASTQNEYSTDYAYWFKRSK